MNMHHHKTLTDYIASHIRESILSGHFPPGTLLSQKSLSEELNVSRTPVREAIQKLENENLIVIDKNRQVKVRSLDNKYLLELYHVREMIDGLGARLLAEQSDQPHFNEIILRLQTILEEMEEVIDVWDVVKWAQCNVKFHMTILENVKNRPLKSQIPLLRMSAEMFQPVVYHNPVRAQVALDQHSLILEAIRLGQGDIAENTARLHIRSASQFIQSLASESSKG